MTPATAIKITYNQPIALYDEVIGRLGFQDGIHSAPGCLSHWVERTEDGFVVHDVWTSEEAFNEFVEGTLMPTGMVAPDKVEVTPAYNVLRSV